MGSIGLGRLELAAIRRLCHHENDSGTSFRPAVILREDHAGILWVKRPWEVTKSCPPISIGQRKDHASILDSLRGNQRHVDVLGGQLCRRAPNLCRCRSCQPARRRETDSYHGVVPLHRSEERRVRTESERPWKSRWAPYHYKK